MSSGSQTLTSHLPMMNKRKVDQASKKPFSKNGGGGFASKGGGKSRPDRERSRQTGLPGGGAERNHLPAGKGHRKFEARGEGRSRTSDQPAAQEKRESAVQKFGDIEAFDLFCAYHLGIGPNKQYKPANIHDVARRFGSDPGTMKQALKVCNMDPESLLDRDFDMALAQLDIQVAPEGVDRTELAKSIYEEYLEAPYKKRDWKKILDEDRKENRKIFGDR